MKFEKVTELVPGTRYKVMYGRSYSYEGTYLTTEKDHRIFKNVTGFDCFTTIKIFHQYVGGGGHYDFYVPIFQKERIQYTMEQRALKHILKSITGDPTFTWAEPTA